MLRKALLVAAAFLAAGAMTYATTQQATAGTDEVSAQQRRGGAPNRGFNRGARPAFRPAARPMGRPNFARPGRPAFRPGGPRPGRPGIVSHQRAGSGPHQRGNSRGTPGHNRLASRGHHRLVSGRPDHRRHGSRPDHFRGGSHHGRHGSRPDHFRFGSRGPSHFRFGSRGFHRRTFSWGPGYVPAPVYPAPAPAPVYPSGPAPRASGPVCYQCGGWTQNGCYMSFRKFVDDNGRAWLRCVERCETEPQGPPPPSTGEPIPEPQR
jgi:hypothetical protein